MNQPNSEELSHNVFEHDQQKLFWLIQDTLKNKDYTVSNNKYLVNCGIAGKIITMKTPIYQLKDKLYNEIKFFADDEDLWWISSKARTIYNHQIKPYLLKASIIM